MFERVQFDEWQTVITAVAFVLCFGTFILFSWRAIRMSRKERQRLSQLPLEETDPQRERTSHD